MVLRAVSRVLGGRCGLANADNLGVIAAAPYAAIKGLRRYRQISTPNRPEKKASPADGPGKRPE